MNQTEKRIKYIQLNDKKLLICIDLKIRLPWLPKVQGVLETTIARRLAQEGAAVILFDLLEEESKIAGLLMS